MAATGGEVSARDSFPSRLPAAVARAVPIFSSEEGHNCASGATAKEKWQSWLAAVEIATSFWRRSRAARHRLRAAKTTRFGPGEVSECAGQAHVNYWHEARIKGQAERFERVRQCGRPWATFKGVREDGREVTAELERRCDCWRVCARCLERRKWLLRDGVLKQRKLAMASLGQEMGRRYKGPEGRWSERLVTLTVAHGEGGPGDDARTLTRAWRRFSRTLADHLKKDRGCEKKPVWVRALEIAPGATGGHAHIHVWYLGPYLEQALLHVWWGDALAECGVSSPQKPLAEALARARDSRTAEWLKTRRGRQGRVRAVVPWPVVDVRAPKSSGEAVASYAQKVGVILYVAKGAKGVARRLHPIHAASVYEGLESARCIQWARGWAPNRKKAWKTWGLQKWTDERFREWVNARENNASNSATNGDDNEQRSAERRNKQDGNQGGNRGSKGAAGVPGWSDAETPAGVADRVGEGHESGTEGGRSAASRRTPVLSAQLTIWHLTHPPPRSG